MSRRSMTCGGSRARQQGGCVAVSSQLPSRRQVPSPLWAGPGGQPFPKASALLRASLSRVMSLDPRLIPHFLPGRARRQPASQKPPPSTRPAAPECFPPQTPGSGAA